jgi:hypothetical protein
MAWCKLDHRYDPKFSNLPFSEEYFDEPIRWKCSGCAYDQGYADAVAGNVELVRLRELDQSQAGTVRHTDPVVAYHWGYRDGLATLP